MPEELDNPSGAKRYLPEPAAKRRGIALCLSGGGYRAALFHLGALRRLNELGVLPRIDTISGVSGGSILAACLACEAERWPKQGPIHDFDGWVGEPFRSFTTKNIRTLWFFRRLLPWNWLRSTLAVESVRRRYERDINPHELTELPERPRFIFSATDMAFGINWISERKRVGSYIPGYVTNPPAGWSIGRAVAASSCFPPAFAPMKTRLEAGRFKGGETPPNWENRKQLIEGLRLTDGGVYDNMGLEPVWKDHAVVLVSDGGATFDFKPDRGLLNGFKRLGRYSGIQGRQSGAMRKRWLISNFAQGDLKGTYWGIGSGVKNYDPSFEGYDEQLVDEVVSEVRTDLDYFSDAESAVLQNHGYLLAEAAMRCHAPDLIDANPPPAKPPFPDWMNPSKVKTSLASSHKRRLLGRWRILAGA